MSKFIGFGKCSKYYLYILGTVIIKAVKDVIFGFSDIDQRNKADFQIIDPIPLFCQHNLFQNLFRYLGLFLGGYIFLKIKKRNIQTRKKSISINKDKLGHDIQLIYTEVGYKQFKKREIIIVAVIMCLYYESKKLLYLMNFFFIDFWTFNVVFIIYFMYKYYNIDFYNFQKCSLLFIIITNTILLIVNTVIPQKHMKYKNEFEL